jgi:hypothetical protein
LTSAEVCANCGLIFVPGSLQRKNDREERSFQRKGVAAFSVLMLLTLLVVLSLVGLKQFSS